MDSDGWKQTLRGVHEAITQNGNQSPEMRLLKLMEEVGEVSQAFIGVQGANTRKGISHSYNDLAKELCDVAITAMVALHDYVEDPVEYLGNHIEKIGARVEKEGS